MQMLTARDKRRDFRLNLRIPMRYKKIQMHQQEFQGSLMHNLSARGVRMTVHEFLPLNSNLALEIPLTSTAKVVQGTARVVWVNKSGQGEQYEAGIEFVNLSQGDHGRIARFVFSNNA